MNCPNCHQTLEGVGVGGIRIDRCPNCQGTWFDKDELRVLKDREDGGDYQWLNVDLWKDIDKFRSRRQQRYSCPKDGHPMTTVHYGQSDIAIFRIREKFPGASGPYTSGGRTITISSMPANSSSKTCSAASLERV